MKSEKHTRMARLNVATQLGQDRQEQDQQHAAIPVDKMNDAVRAATIKDQLIKAAKKRKYSRQQQ